MSTLPLSSQAVTTTCMPAICALAGLVPCAEEGIRQMLRWPWPRLVPGLDGQQAGVLALRAGVGLQADAGIARGLAQPGTKLHVQFRIALQLVARRERVHVRELRPGDGDHLAGGVELDRAVAQRDHAAVQRQVLVGEGADVAQHAGFAVVRVEHRVREVVAVAQLLRDRGLDAFLEGRHLRQHLAWLREDRPQQLEVGARGGFVERDADVFVPGGAQVGAQGMALGDQRLRGFTGVQGDRVEGAGARLPAQLPRPFARMAV